VTCVQGPSSEADLARGGVNPRVRWTWPEGAFSPERGGPRPRGRSAVPLWWAAGATQRVCFWARELVRVLHFFMSFKRVSLVI
jgi:hypothetical protein